ncbi:uncharacterized protein N7477_003250 [Penicillium maclennaniae]|uniref:uncharacterized protein n=1 Tax=Penicillium maclennaniae TaxID=1343394 RepID=UPI002540D107|nr:uncharacterized protein N7477_003250 [Penicillium maclennaniae]KAJ5677617.1 hypothetical protein N7477_003250 [Penicillium maclennaniae]
MPPLLTLLLYHKVSAQRLYLDNRPGMPILPSSPLIPQEHEQIGLNPALSREILADLKQYPNLKNCVYVRHWHDKKNAQWCVLLQDTTVQPVILKTEHPIPETLFVDSVENFNTASAKKPGAKPSVESAHDASGIVVENTMGETTEVNIESTAEIDDSLFVEQAPLAIGGQIPRDRWLEREFPAFDNDLMSVNFSDLAQHIAIE